jgi:hypothetical protein
MVVQDCSLTFENVFERWSWKPIRNCPGRLTLNGGISELSLAQIAGADSSVFEFSVKACVDKILVMKFDDNSGLISYRKTENSFLHTLNNAEGFSRKLRQLNIELPKYERQK